MRRSPRRRMLAAAGTAAAVALLAGGLAGCTSSGSELTVYSGRQKELVGPILERFAEETGISVAVRYGDSADLALLIDTEGDQSPADVFLSQSPGAMAFLDGNDRLTELDARTLDEVPARFRADDGDWVGVTGRVRVLVYNTDLVAADELPQSVFDLTDSRYRGRVALAPTNASFQDFVSAMRAQVGDDATAEWLRAMKDNGSPTYANNTAIVEAVGRGEVAMGLVNHYYNEKAKADDPTLPSANHFFGGDDLGSLVLVSTVGILDSSDQRRDAEQLVRFLLRESSQEYFVEETFEYPLVAGVEPPAGLPALDAEGPALDLSTLPDLEGTRRLIADSGLEQS